MPVYLGDSMQWNQRRDLFTEDHLVVPTGSGDQLFDAEFRFPDRFLADAAHFDRLVSTLADHAAKRTTPGRDLHTNHTPAASRCPMRKRDPSARRRRFRNA